MARPTVNIVSGKADRAHAFLRSRADGQAKVPHHVRLGQVPMSGQVLSGCGTIRARRERRTEERDRCSFQHLSRVRHRA